MSSLWFQLGAHYAFSACARQQYPDVADDRPKPPTTMRDALRAAVQDHDEPTLANRRDFYRGWRVGNARYWLQAAVNQVFYLNADELETVRQVGQQLYYQIRTLVLDQGNDE